MEKVHLHKIAEQILQNFPHDRTVFVTIAVKNGSHRNQVGGKFAVYLSYNSNPAYINRSTKLLKLYKYPKDP